MTINKIKRVHLVYVSTNVNHVCIQSKTVKEILERTENIKITRKQNKRLIVGESIYCLSSQTN